MADEIEKKDDAAKKVEQPATEAPAAKPESKTASETPAKVEGKEGAKPADAKVEGKAGEEPKAGEAKAPRELKDEDEDLPDDEDLVTLKSSALKKRIARATKKELRARFGTDDFDSIKAKLDKAAEAEKKAEEARRAQLSKEEKLEEDLKRERARANELETRVKRQAEAREYETQDRRMIGIATKHVDDDAADYVVTKFCREHAKKPQAEIDALTDKDIDKWFAKYAKDHPKFARTAPEVKKVPMDNTAKDDRPAPANGDGLAGKTYAPGKQNSMTPTQARAAAAREGYKW